LLSTALSVPPPPRRSPAWLRLLDALFGIVAGVFLVRGVGQLRWSDGGGMVVLVTVVAALFVGWTCLDMARNRQRRRQGRELPALVGGLARLLGLLLAATAVIFVMLFGLMSLDSDFDTPSRIFLAMIAAYEGAIALWLQRETQP
jgi:hypothetical protein